MADTKLFRKWRSIENLDDFLAEEELKYFDGESRYLITEKLDGSNLLMAWDAEKGAFSFFTRNGNDPFETVKGFDVFAGTVGDLAELCRREYEARTDLAAVGFYGELIGSKAMNRLNYSKELQVRLFHFYRETKDGRIEHTSFPALNEMLKEAGLIEKYGMPVLGEVPLKALVGWQAPAYKSSFETAVGFEGVVFHPADGNWTRRIFKWKTPEFREVSRRTPRIKIEQNAEAARIIEEGRTIFKTYITENRAWAVLSKFGSVQTKTIGKATAVFITDAREDFLKDHPEFAGSEHLKDILNVGSEGFFIMRKLVMQRIEAESKSE